MLPAFLEALFCEMALMQAAWAGARFDTCYIGGGTPSLLPPHDLKRLFQEARRHFTLADNAEITVEVNPESASSSLYAALIECGVSRLSIGVQSFSGRELSLLGRGHTVIQARRILNTARSADFRNIGIDLMYGLPGQSARIWQRSLQSALALRPEHISAYALTCSEPTPLGRAVKKGDLTLPDDSLVSEMFMAAHESLTAAGYDHYEVSNYALPGFACRHNEGYWNHAPYLGLGPSAHSFTGNVRSWNISHVKHYIEMLSQKKLPCSEERLTQSAIYLERIALGLRTREGVPLDLLTGRESELDGIKRDKLGFISGGRLRLTPKGFLLADALAVRLSRDGYLPD
jgi:oxygen-independent coproporphyrinogen-3 oxidase